MTKIVVLVSPNPTTMSTQSASNGRHRCWTKRVRMMHPKTRDTVLAEKKEAAVLGRRVVVVRRTTTENTTTLRVVVLRRRRL